MNYLDTTNEGGHPLYLEDLGFIQDAYKEAIAGITQGLGADSYILSGCQKSLQSPGIWHISEGFVVLDKEVFKVPAHTVTFLNENAPLYFKIKIDFPLPSPVFYKEKGAVEMNVHNRRIANVTTEETEWSFELPTTSILMDRLGRIESGHLGPDKISNLDLITYQIMNGQFFLGGLINASPSALNNLFEIPTQFMPSYIPEYWYGTMNALPSGYDLLKYANYYSVPCSLYCYSSANSRLSNELGILAITPSPALSSPPPRKGQVHLVKPTVFPTNTSRVYINLSGISWPIAPR